MAVEIGTGTGNVDLTSLLKGTDMGNLLSGVGGNGEGLGGGLLLGLLLGRTNLLSGDNNGAAAHTLTAADVQNIVSANTNSQTLGNLEGEIWKAEGQLQGQLLAQSNTQQITTLNAEIATLQGQSGILASISNVAKDVINEVHETGEMVNNSVNVLSAAQAAGFGVVNTNIAQSTYATSLAISNDGEKTRSAIALLAASIPNARELDLQRQLTVALDDHRHSNTRAAVDSGNVSVITNVAQSQAQVQAQQQAITMNGLLSQLVEAQHATNTAITIGNGNRPTQTASNVNA
jgi:hypothetical protein